MNQFEQSELSELMSRAKAAFEALTPEEQAAHRREQRIREKAIRRWFNEEIERTLAFLAKHQRVASVGEKR